MLPRCLRVWLINLLLILTTPVQTLNAPTAMPDGTPYPNYPAHSDRGNFAEDVNWSDREPRRDFLDLTPDTDQPVDVEEPVVDSLHRDSLGDTVWHPGTGVPANDYLPLELPPDIHPFHEEELERQRVLLINQPNAANNGVYTVSRSDAPVQRYTWEGTPDGGRLVPVTEPQPPIREVVMEQSTRELEREIDEQFYRNVVAHANGASTVLVREQESVVIANPAAMAVVHVGAAPINYRGLWLARESYERGDMVSRRDSTAWVAEQPNSGVEPDSWEDEGVWRCISVHTPEPPRLHQPIVEATVTEVVVHEPSMFEQPKCPWCGIRNCEDPRHPETMRAIHEIAERGGF